MRINEYLWSVGSCDYYKSYGEIRTIEVSVSKLEMKSVSSLSSSSSNSVKTTSTRQRSVALRRTAKPRGRKVPAIPWAAHWGWSHLPFAAKVLILGVFCGAVSLTTPFWAYLRTDTIGYATYGLWHFCRGEQCASIHDNILDGKSVPGEFLWFLDSAGCIAMIDWKVFCNTASYAQQEIPMGCVVGYPEPHCGIKTVKASEVWAPKLWMLKM
jgi:hypothetical protein